jgi:DNA-binding NtrC family response regulator
MLFLFRPVSSANQDWEELSAQHPAASFNQTAGHIFSGELARRAKRLAMTEETILIQGEEGTGKRLLAQCIHEFSNRSQMPMVSVDCGWPYHAGQDVFSSASLGASGGALEHAVFPMSSGCRFTCIKQLRRSFRHARC